MNEFEFRPDRTTDYGVSRPWASKKSPYRPYNGENGVSTFSLLFLIESFWYFHVTRTSIKAWMSLNFLKWDLTLAHWTQVSDRCPLGCLFVICLQQFVKHINPQLQPCHLNVSFLPYRCIKAVIILSYHRELLSFLYTLLKYYRHKYFKFYFTFQNIFSASNVRNNTSLLKRNPLLSYFMCERRSCFYKVWLLYAWIWTFCVDILGY